MNEEQLQTVATRIVEIIDYAKKHLAHDGSGHGFDHAQRVAHLAQKILLNTKETVDATVVLAACYLHDTIDDKVVADVEGATEDLREFLETQGLSSDQVLEILFIIDNLSFSKQYFGNSLELPLSGQIVQDADRLEALGAMGLMRTAYFGGYSGHPLYDPAIKPKTFTSKAEYRQGTTVINHVYEKLFLLVDMMNTAYGKEEGQRRKAFMEDFLKEFYQEWEI
ncbi:HD domain-containing protein [Enterococcus asini]|uniref:HD domain-containing protein n=1 Tax=Enterococcus asini TaxID=57732 RepID=UPI00288E20F7|nr:HD domain-containing protein [Enterococcus asini]MDT2757824.1 HD domain-containing protein [Enterococcus asini]